MNKVMVMEMVSMVESTSVVGGVIDNLIEVSSFMGEVNVVWNQLNKDEMLKEAIMEKLEQEDRDNTMMLEFQMKEERLERQEKAREAWREARNNNNILSLTKALSRIELEEDDEQTDDLDDEGDYRMLEIDVTESEDEIDAILNQMMINLEGSVMGTEKVVASNVRPGWKSSQADRPGNELVPISDDEYMAVDDDPKTDAEVEENMDDNDTMPNINHMNNSFEEWVVKEQL